MQVQATEARYEKQRRLIAEAVDQLQSEDSFKAWVRTRAVFRSYSLHNTLLIALQYPEATRVAGLRAWNKLGRRVLKGEKGIGIVAPIVAKTEPASEEQAEQAEAERAEQAASRVVGWKLVYVFDLSQTEGEPLPEPPASAQLNGSRLGHLIPALESLASKLGFAVEYGQTGPARGYCDLTSRLIRVDESLSPDDRVATLIHELAHAQGIDYQSFSRSEAEVIVETAAAIVLLGLGVDVEPRSIPYIAGWQAGSAEDARQTVERHAQAIDRCARTIEQALAA